jgi:hypothetical protein
VVEEQPTFGVEAEQLRPGVPLVRVRGRLDLPAADSLRLVVDKVLDDRPWAVVLDMSGLVEMPLDLPAFPRHLPQPVRRGSLRRRCECPKLG